MNAIILRRNCSKAHVLPVSSTAEKCPVASLATTGSFLLMLLLISSTGLIVSGCGSEMSATRQPNLKGQSVGMQERDTGASIGALPADSAADPPPVPEAIIRPGDQVQVMVWGYPEFNTTTTVKNYGTITVPLIGDVIAAGLTENRLTAELKRRLSEYLKADARVNISHVSMNNRISVMGAVNKQGNYAALGDISLVEVIADAGGTSTDADLRHVKIIREGKAKNAEEVDLQQYYQIGSFEDVPLVRPGDTVFVPAEENLIRVIGSFGQDILVLFGFFSLLR